MTNSEKERSKQTAATFLPDFCNIRIVFSVIVIAELLAFFLTLATPTYRGGGWGYLSLLSLYIQWIALISIAALCATRPLLSQLSNNSAAVAAYGLLMLITIVFSETTYWISRAVSSGILSINMPHWEFLGRNLAICAIVSFLALRYFFLQFQLKKNVEAENQYRLQALQARIRPHFLFNTLNTIASLIRREPKQAEEAVEDLADIFRHTLDDADAMTTLATELEIGKRYLHMEQLRLGNRLKVEWDIDALPTDAALPSLTLQPLLENAIYHGISNLSEGGTILCQGARQGKTLRLVISNPVAAATEPANKSQGKQMALDNIRQRLQAHFEEQGRLKTSQQDNSYRVELRFPYQPL